MLLILLLIFAAKNNVVNILTKVKFNKFDQTNFTENLKLSIVFSQQNFLNFLQKRRTVYSHNFTLK
jgi:hypothetical protein